MFADATNAGDFDLDFPTDVGVDGSDPFGDTSGAEFSVLSGNTTGNGTGGLDSEDINSLLPGLESYVNVEDGGPSTGDNSFAMIDIPGEGAFDANGGLGGVNASAGDSKENGAEVTSGDTTMGGTGTGSGAGENGDVDDIFADMLDMGSGDGGLGLDLDDSWFNT